MEKNMVGRGEQLSCIPGAVWGEEGQGVGDEAGRWGGPQRTCTLACQCPHP